MLALSTTLLIPAQVSAAVLGLVGMTLWPPDSGAMLLVPIGQSDANAGARIALAGGARLLGGGPFPGSLVVVGERSRIAGQIGTSHFFLVAAPPAGCGTRGVARVVT